MDIVDADGKPLPGRVELPTDKLVELEPGRSHLMLWDVREVIRDGDFIKYIPRFEKAGSNTFNIQSQIPPTTKLLPAGRCVVRVEVCTDCDARELFLLHRIDESNKQMMLSCGRDHEIAHALV